MKHNQQLNAHKDICGWLHYIYTVLYSKPSKAAVAATATAATVTISKLKNIYKKLHKKPTITAIMLTKR